MEPPQPTKTSPPPQDQEPDPKKLKMSSTSSDDAGAVANPRYKRRKIAIFFAYCGVGYQGMQKNPGAKTIESELEEALFRAGAVPEQDRGNAKRYDFARSARTDKGVSAVGQVVSGKFYIDPPGLVDRLNAILPGQIRIFGFKRVTASFSSKKFCDRRRYVYLIPVFALDPTCHRDRESVMASLGSGSELVKCLPCSERGRKVFGVMGKRSFEPKPHFDSMDCSENAESVLNSVKVTGSVNGDAIVETELKEVVVSDIVDSKTSDLATSLVPNEGRDLNSESMKQPVVSQENVNSNNVGVMRGSILNEGSDLNSELLVASIAEIEGTEESRFCYGEEEKGRFNRILKNYVGSHNFHNFTTRMKSEDPAAMRYIISFDASTTVTVDGIDFVKCEVVGQSFMLHQIRKMMGLAVAIMRNCAPESLIETALQKDVHINVPTAPEVGLYLDECMFSSYNQKWKDTHEELSMKDYAEEAEDFKMKHIYTHIAATEHKEGVVGLWLHSLNLRNYADLGYMSSNGGIPNTKVEVNDGKIGEEEKVSENGKSEEAEKDSENGKCEEADKNIE